MLMIRNVKQNIKHQNIGGKRIEIEFELSKDDVIKREKEGNWPCFDFITRREDFNSISFDKKLYYGKINNLSYIVADDEIER